MSNTGQLGGCSDSSLEHCYTNIFALTDFSGIQYRKYVLRSEKEYKSALEDPLIKSYALCQKNSVLSAWVRCKRDSLEKQDPCVSAKFQKELWVFWYGNGDFPNADSCILPELCEEDRGNWRQGLSYETRTVLFRALHNVVEKCLLNKGFVRLGKWFIQPYKHNYNHDYIQYSIGFSFFLHGESTVCASLDLRQHPLVRRIGLKHLQLCSVNQRTIPVVLAPYGISAELVGVGSSQKNEDFSSDYECWCNFYPMRSANEQEYDDSPTVGLPQFAKTAPSLQATRNPGQLKHNSSDKKTTNENLFKGPDSTPTFVEVIAGGFRMRYPTCYVLLCDSDWDDQSSDFIHPDTSKLKSAPPVTNRKLSSTQFNFDIKPDSSTLVGLREPKTSTLWRLPRRKIHASVSFASTDLKSSLRSAKYTLQSNLAFDVRRIYLAERALRLSCHDIFLPSIVRRKWSHTKRQPSCAAEFTVAVTSVQPTACIYGLSARCPFTKCSCTCLRYSSPHQLSGRVLFHHVDASTRCALRTLGNEGNPYSEHTRSPRHTAIACSVPHDPSMPTLSPQQPTSLPGPNATSTTNWSFQNKCSNDTSASLSHKTDPSSIVSCATVLTAPPPLCSIGIVSRIDSTKPDTFLQSLCTTSVNGLPNGLVSIEHPVPPNLHTGNMTLLKGSSTEMSIYRRSLKNFWLTEQANQVHQVSLGNLKRQALRLDPADEAELRLLSTTGVVPSVVSRPCSPSFLEFGVTDDPPHGDENHLRVKRARLTHKVNPNDSFEWSIEDTVIQPSFEQLQNAYASFDPTAISPDTSFTATELELYDDDPHDDTVANDLSLYTPSFPSVVNSTTNTILGRTLGLLPHKGVSLASSTGSGHLGAAELALMLPTPPSHDAPQPSPVDGMTMTTAAMSTNASRSNHSSVAMAAPDSPAPASFPNQPALLDTGGAPPDQSGCPPYYLHQQPWSPQHAQLLNLAKQPCIQSFNFSALDLNQDWLFTRPCAAYLGVASCYQVSRNDLSSYQKGLPRLNLAFDHRTLSTKLPLVPTSLDAVYLPTIHSQLALSPTQQTAAVQQSKSVPDSPSPPAVPAQTCEAIAMEHKSLSPHSFSGATTTMRDALPLSRPTSLSDPTLASEELLERLPSLIEANGILMNIILSDSMLNLFKDHNFDSCNICECTSSVLGSEVDLYLSNFAPPLHIQNSKNQRSSLGSVSSGGGGLGTHDLVGGSTFGSANSCKCGFSAVMNQKYVVNGNLFYEDEVEVTNLCLRLDHSSGLQRAYSVIPTYKRQPGWWSGPPAPTHEHLVLLQEMMNSVYEEFSVRQLTDYLRRTNLPSPFTAMKENMLEYDDACTLVTAALLEASKSRDIKSTAQVTLDSEVAVHPSYLFKAQSRIPENHNDQIRLLATMRPWLQEAISSTRLLESNYTVDGPLTWKAFHQLAGRGSDETCKSQPIPQLRVSSSDKEHLLISPFAVRDWDRLCLSPLSLPKQLAYAVVLPNEFSDVFKENDISLNSVISGGDLKHLVDDRTHLTDPGQIVPDSERSLIIRTSARFFKELSLTYENCRLGQHLPYREPELNHPETAFILVHSAEDKSSSEPEEITFSADLQKTLVRELDGHCASPEVFLNRLQSYVSGAFYHALSAFKERGVSVSSRTARGTSHVECSDLFPNFPSQRTNTVVKMDYDKENNTEIKVRSNHPRNGKILGHSSTNPRNGQGPLTSSLDTSSWGTISDTYLLIYLLNPFSQVCDVSPNLSRIVMQAFVGCAHKIITSLPDSWQPRVRVQLLSLEHIMSDYLPRLRSFALSIYSSVNRYIEPSLMNANRTLTGIGPAAEKEAIANEKESFHKRSVNAPPYSLVGSQDFFGQWDTPPSDPFYRSSVLFVAYCLSQDQQWLVASFTDEQGSLLDQTLINIRVPSCFFSALESRKSQQPNNENCGRFISPRRIGLMRLWDYVINLISRTSNPWRLVIGRVGRLGHGELKGWNGLLGRKSLQDVNRFFRERCSACNTSAAVPSQLSSTGTKTTLNLVNCSSGANSCTHELPSLISACLVSLEPQSTFRVYPGVTLSPDDAWACGGGGGGSGGGGGIGGTGVGSVGGGGGANTSGIGGAYGVSSASPYTMRTMMMLGSANFASDVPSTTHILVFPTSTFASGLPEHDAAVLDDVIGIGLLDWLRSGDLDASGNAMFEEFSNPSGLEFGIAGLGGAVGPGGVSDHCGAPSTSVTCVNLGDPGDNILNQSDYGSTLRDHRGHERASDVLGLHDLETGGMDLDVNMLNGLAASHRLVDHLSDENAAVGSGLFCTMPYGMTDPPDEVANLMQQPLAMGYYISTAPAGPLPAWFWAACPHSSLQFPICLKSALHLQTSLVGLDDAAAVGPTAPTPTTPGPCGSSGAEKPNHLLDSTSTCDVLRYVLEAYNALSWLTVNPITNDRRSCLPIHMLILCQLYQALESFV